MFVKYNYCAISSGNLLFENWRMFRLYVGQTQF